MRLLLDTHLAFWWQTGDSRLDGEARRVTEGSNDAVLVSQVSLWELGIKAGLGKLRIDLPVFASQVEAMGFSWLPIEMPISFISTNCRYSPTTKTVLTVCSSHSPQANR